jgi:hypothetical protein
MLGQPTVLSHGVATQCLAAKRSSDRLLVICVESEGLQHECYDLENSGILKILIIIIFDYFFY